MSEFAPIYALLAERHVSSATVDAAEIYQVAAMLGVTAPGAAAGGKRDLAAERVAAARAKKAV